MNHKFDRLLTISAFTGWGASIAALLMLGAYHSQPNGPRATQIAPDIQLSASIAPRHFPFKVAGVELSSVGVNQEPALGRLDSQHWLDRNDPIINQLNPPDPVASSDPSLWLTHSD